MHFDFVDLRLLTALGETANLARAANLCHMSAPAASSRLKNLEDFLGVRLLYRTSQGMIPTPAGECFIRHALLMREQVDRLAGDIEQFGSGMAGHIRVWTNTTAITGALPDTLGRFLCEHAHVNIELREAPSDDIVRGVTGNLADIGIVAGNIDAGQLEMLPYQNERLVLVTQPGHPLAERDAVCFAETLDNDFVDLPASSAIHAFVHRAATTLGRSLRIRIEVGSFDAACRMIAAGAGIGIVPASIAWKHARVKDIVMVALKDEWAERRLNICVRSVADLPLFTRELVAMLASDVVDSTRRVQP